MRRALLSGLLALAGCHPPLHVTPAVPVPLMSRGGEVQVAGGLSVQGLSASVAYAPLAPLSLFALGEVEGVLDQGAVRRTRLEGGGGLGLFAPLGGDWHAEVLGGATTGSLETQGTRAELTNAFVPVSVPVSRRADPLRLFLQANVGQRRAGGAALGASLRVERVVYRDYVFFRYDVAEAEPEDVAGTFVGPSVFGRFGRGPLLGTATLSYAVPLVAVPFEVERLRASVGVLLRLDGVLGRPGR